MIIREHKKVKDVKLREQTSSPISFLLKSTPVYFPPVLNIDVTKSQLWNDKTCQKTGQALFVALYW